MLLSGKSNFHLEAWIISQWKFEQLFPERWHTFLQEVWATPLWKFQQRSPENSSNSTLKCVKLDFSRSSRNYFLVSLSNFYLKVCTAFLWRQLLLRRFSISSLKFWATFLWGVLGNFHHLTTGSLLIISLKDCAIYSWLSEV